MGAQRVALPRIARICQGSAGEKAKLAETAEALRPRSPPSTTRWRATRTTSSSADKLHEQGQAEVERGTPRDASSLCACAGAFDGKIEDAFARFETMESALTPPREKSRLLISSAGIPEGRIAELETENAVDEELAALKARLAKRRVQVLGRDPMRSWISSRASDRLHGDRGAASGSSSNTHALALEPQHFLPTTKKILADQWESVPR
jgi:hypothetical protein